MRSSSNQENLEAQAFAVVRNRSEITPVLSGLFSSLPNCVQ